MGGAKKDVFLLSWQLPGGCKGQGGVNGPAPYPVAGSIKANRVYIVTNATSCREREMIQGVHVQMEILAVMSFGALAPNDTR